MGSFLERPGIRLLDRGAAADGRPGVGDVFALLRPVAGNSPGVALAKASVNSPDNLRMAASSGLRWGLSGS